MFNRADNQSNGALTNHNASSGTLEERIQGSRAVNIAREFVTNSALFPIFDAIRVMAAEGVGHYLAEPAHYALFVAALVQAWFLGYWRIVPWYQRLVGNLVGPTLYTLVDLALEGPHFFDQPYHAVYWGFSLTVALLSAWQSLASQEGEALPTILLNLARTSLFPVIYAIAEVGSEMFLGNSFWSGVVGYFGGNEHSSGHRFIFIGALFFGLLLGLGEAQLIRYTAFLRRAASQLKRYSDWSFGSSLVESTFENPEVLNLQRVERTMLFMDVRGFTAWSEATDPAQVVAMLNGYYEVAEAVIRRHRGHKPLFTADEVMTRFRNPKDAVMAAVELQNRIGDFLAPYGLSAGIGIHTGQVIEGLIGSSTTRMYNVIGDAVNTAKRLESAAGPGEILVSADTKAQLPPRIPFLPPRSLAVKGKSEPVLVFPTPALIRR